MNALATASGTTAFPVAERSCKVLFNRQVNRRYKLIALEAAEPFTRARAGQFFHLLCPQQAGLKPFLRRPMSVYGVRPAGHRIEFLYQITGSGTQSLGLIEPGDALNAVGPLGIGFSFDPSWKRVLVVARGVGMATLAPLVPLAGGESGGAAMSAVLSAREPDDLMQREFEQGAAISVHALFDSDGSSAVESVEALLRRLIASERPDMMYTCGSSRLLKLLQRLGREFGIPGEAALEQQMACAFGVCLCCVREFEVAGAHVHKRVCCEGPVFDLQQVVVDSPWSI